MENVSERLGVLDGREEVAIERVSLEILRQVLSNLPRNDRLATSRCCQKFRKINEEFTWKSIHVEIGDSSEYTGHTPRSLYLFENLPYLCTTLLKNTHLGRYTVKLSLEVWRYRTYKMMMELKFLRQFSSLQELSLSPPPSDFELPVKPATLRLDFHYSRRTFWNSRHYFNPQLVLGQYFKMPNLRKLQIEHISFESQMHDDSFPGPQQLSSIEDLVFVDCSPQTVGVLAKMLLSVKCLKTLCLELNVPRPVVEGFHRHSDWNRPGGQDYGLAISPHTQSLEELMIAFSDGASFFIRPFSGRRPFTSEQPLVPPIGNLDKFINLRRLAIPESLLAQDAHGTRYSYKRLPELVEELQLQLPIAITVPPPRFRGGLGARIARMHALAEDKETVLPRLKRVICWHQQYAPSGPAGRNNETFYNLEGSWGGLGEAFDDVGVRVEVVLGPFFEDTPFGQPLNISHGRLRHPDLVRQGHFIYSPTRPGLYYDLSTHSVF